MCIKKGKLIMERRFEKWTPKNIAIFLSIIIGMLTIVSTLYAGAVWLTDKGRIQSGMDKRMFDTPEQKIHVIDHVNETDFHQPYKDKLKEWYTREEGEDVELRLEKLEDMNHKLDDILEAVKGK